MPRVFQMFLTAFVLTYAGCGIEPPPNMTPQLNKLPKTEIKTGQTVERVLKITCELLEVDVDRINSDATLADLGADELDLVELTMELEEEFSTTIPDEAVEKLAGEGDWVKRMKRITIKKLAELVEQPSGPQSK